MNKKYNLGRFSVPKSFVEETPYDVIDALSRLKIVPVKVDYNKIKGVYEHTAYSPNFDPVKKGDKIPKYSILVTRVTEDTLLPTTFKLKFKVEKVEENNE